MNGLCLFLRSAGEGHSQGLRDLPGLSLQPSVPSSPALRASSLLGLKPLPPCDLIPPPQHLNGLLSFSSSQDSFWISSPAWKSKLGAGIWVPPLHHLPHANPSGPVITPLNYVPVLSASSRARCYYCFVHFCIPCISFWACHRKHGTSDLMEAGNLDDWVGGMMEGSTIGGERLWVGSSPV